MAEPIHDGAHDGTYQSQTKTRANRQSFHTPDVKNGILAGSKLCGSLRSVLEHLHCDHSRRSSTVVVTGASDGINNLNTAFDGVMSAL
jgi:hypothetical protein